MTLNVTAFVDGAIFTPPDVVLQFKLARPLRLSFEAGIVVAVWMAQKPGMARTIKLAA